MNTTRHTKDINVKHEAKYAVDLFEMRATCNFDSKEYRTIQGALERCTGNIPHHQIADFFAAVEYITKDRLDLAAEQKMLEED